MGAYRIREFLRMNHPEFSGSKVEEDPNGFIDEVYKTLAIMGVTSREKAELAAYQLKDFTQIWYEQCKDARPVEAGPIEWETFKLAFLDRFFPWELREAKLEEFINLKQGNMSVNEYSLRFTLLSKYAPSLVASPRDLMNRFMTGVSDLIAPKPFVHEFQHIDGSFSRMEVHRLGKCALKELPAEQHPVWMIALSVGGPTRQGRAKRSVAPFGEVPAALATRRTPLAKIPGLPTDPMSCRERLPIR
ncbi:uncharacterized protein LOC125823361 [Solanum verrucosum]|uniref:uncharacterized protein LOC125823361 n=1 Tax=Solanum verrucosum TaxID=315347 RepID=UPI0020D03991|nr:uncharacterized protein LOC125823361 [Solanum verrucosum]